MSFSELQLSEPILRAVAELGYSIPTPIQLQAIPAVMAGGDLLAGAQTGTGKTAGFTLPLLHRLSQRSVHKPHGDARHAHRHVIRALILTPTRELAAQVEQSVRDYGKYLSLRSMTMFGGVGIVPQIEQLKRGVDILVATPGRLLDHMQQRTVDLSSVEVLVLDEADRMLDMGFIRDIRRVLAVLPPNRQNLLFSATFSDEIKTLANGLLKSPTTIEVARRNTTAQGVGQRVLPVDRERKRELLSHLIKTRDWSQVLVFTRTKHGANRLAEQLNRDGISALAIHGNKSQSARTRALAEFKANALRVLVATDIAARGIDIDQLPHVVNFDLPNVPEDYVHRIGRTGRAGASGEAISLVCIDEKDLLTDIERLIKKDIPVEQISGFEPDPTIAPEPIQKRSGPRGAPAPRGRPDANRSKAAGAPRGGSAPAARGPRAEAPRLGGGSSGNGSNGRPAQVRREPGRPGVASETAKPSTGTRPARQTNEGQPRAAAPVKRDTERRTPGGLGALLGGSKTGSRKG